MSQVVRLKLVHGMHHWFARGGQTALSTAFAQSEEEKKSNIIIIIILC